jgi:membrane-bound lytic murein transglycosylase D
MAQAGRRNVAQAPRRTRAPATARTASNTAAIPSPSSNVRIHTIRKGDTLSGIAKQYGTTVASLRALNNLKSDKLRIGAKLRVPGTTNRS